METQINYEIWIKTSDGKNNYRQVACSADPNPENWYEIYLNEQGNLLRITKYVKDIKARKIRKVVYYQRGFSPEPVISRWCNGWW